MRKVVCVSCGAEIVFDCFDERRGEPVSVDARGRLWVGDYPVPEPLVQVLEGLTCPSCREQFLYPHALATGRVRLAPRGG